ncbi:MAG TPA: efflux RND transporter periplasmic adaptor subunit [Gemmatimonadaceae bacterium]|nr:efflux RND transporter periplasmic adaptor subunit [Gemmatimonadaceae bacterium]
MKTIVVRHRPFTVMLAAIAVTLASAAACSRGSDAEAAAGDVVVRDTALLSAEAVRIAGLVIAPAESLPWVDAWTTPARLTLDPIATHALGAIAEGRVSRVLARVGDRVAQGQVLVAVHSHEMMDALSTESKAVAAESEAAAARALAESAAARAERLYAIKSLALADLERARTALVQAQAAHSQARAELDRARALRGHLVGAGAVPPGTDQHEVLVRSPMDGIIVRLDARPGEVVLVGAPLVTVSRTTSLVLQMSIPEQLLGRAKPGSRVRFTVPAFPGESFAATVAHVAPTLDSATRAVAVQANVEGDVERLRAEMYVSAELLGVPDAATLSVPATALQAFDGDTVVIAARSRSGGVELEAVRVRVGRRTTNRAEIVAGLSAGTPVVTDGAAVAKAELLRRRAGT